MAHVSSSPSYSRCGAQSCISFFLFSSTLSGSAWPLQDQSGGLRKERGQESCPCINADRTWHPFPLGMLGIKTETRFSGYSVLILYVWALHKQVPVASGWLTFHNLHRSHWPLRSHWDSLYWDPKTYPEVHLVKSLFRMTPSLSFLVPTIGLLRSMDFSSQ